MPSKSTRNWLELPLDLTLNILQRVDVVDRLENAPKVCTTWREICKNPAMWRVICIYRLSGHHKRAVCKDALDRSQGQLVDLTYDHYFDYELLQYAVDSLMYGKWIKAFSKLPLLEELNFARTDISLEDIEAAGRYCPLLKTLKLNHKPFRFDDNAVALAIGKNLPQLTHLELIQNGMQNVGLQAILDGCCHLESLDLRECRYLDLNGSLGQRCSQQIKHLKLPYQSL